MSRDTSLLPGELRQRRVEALLREMDGIARKLADEGCTVIAGIHFDSPISNSEFVTHIVQGSPFTSAGVARLLSKIMDEVLLNQFDEQRNLYDLEDEENGDDGE